MKGNPTAQSAPESAAERTASPTLLWLIRHAEVEVRYQGIFGGRIDMNLSPRGHDQAAALARYLAELGLTGHGREAPSRGPHRPFVDCYISPMQRVRQTYAPVAAGGGPPPVVVPDLREVDFGDWTGLSWDEVRQHYGVSAFSWLDQLAGSTIPNAEDAAASRARIEPVVRQLLAQHAGRSFAIFCHGGVIRVILAFLLDWPLPRTAALDIDYASVTRVALTPAAELQLLNFVPWRDLP